MNSRQDLYSINRVAFIMIFMLPLMVVGSAETSKKGMPQNDAAADENLAYFHSLLDKYAGVYDTQAVLYCEQIIKLSEGQNNPTELAYGYSRLGEVRVFLQDDSLAVEAFDEAEEIYSRQGLRDSLKEIYISLVDLHRSQNNLDKATERQRSLIELNEFFGDQEATAKSKLELASLVSDNQETEKAKNLVNEAIQYFLDAGDTLSVIESKQMLVTIHQNNEEYQDALDEINIALELLADEESDLKAVLLYQKGLLNEELGNNSLAINNLKNALELAQQLNENQLVSSFSGQLVAVLEKTGQFEKALKYHKLHMKSREAVLTQSGVEAISAIGNRLKVADEITLPGLDQEGQAEESRKVQYQMPVLIILSALIVVSLVTILYLLLKSRRLNKKLQSLRADIKGNTNLHTQSEPQHSQSLASYNQIFGKLSELITKQSGRHPEGLTDNRNRMLESLPQAFEALHYFTSLESGNQDQKKEVFSLSHLVKNTTQQVAKASNELDFEVGFYIDDRLFSKYQSDQTLCQYSIYFLLETVIENNMSGDIHLHAVPAGENLNMIEFFAGSKEAADSYSMKKTDFEKNTSDLLPDKKLSSLHVCILKKAVALMGGRFYASELNTRNTVFSVMIPMKGAE